MIDPRPSQHSSEEGWEQQKRCQPQLSQSGGVINNALEVSGTLDISTAQLPRVTAFTATLAGLDRSVTTATSETVTAAVSRNIGSTGGAAGVSQLKRFIGGWYLGMRMYLWNRFLRKIIWYSLIIICPQSYSLILVTFVLFSWLVSSHRNSLSGSRVHLLHAGFLVTVVAESSGEGE